MNHTFCPLKEKWEKRVKINIYMEDILIAMSTLLQDHRDTTHDVLDLLQKHGLFLKKKKCRWEVNSIDYLWLILEKGVTCMDLTIVEGIKNWPRPAKIKDVHSFLGLATSTVLSYQAFQKSQNSSTNLPAKTLHLYGRINMELHSTPYKTTSQASQHYDNHN